MLPTLCAIDYSLLLKQGGDQKDHSTLAFLDVLSTSWIAAYKRQVNRKTNINEMWFNGFSALVDLAGSDHCDGRGPQPPGVFPRTLVAYGLSTPPAKGRGTDDQRLRGMEPAAPELGVGRDKGAFIAHSIGGAVLAAETNVFSQRRDLNRGWSTEGKTFRLMERYAAENAGTPYFHRAVYTSESDIPDCLEVGIIRPDGTLWTESFNNHAENAGDGNQASCR